MMSALCKDCNYTIIIMLKRHFYFVLSYYYKTKDNSKENKELENKKTETYLTNNWYKKI